MLLSDAYLHFLPQVLSLEGNICAQSHPSPMPTVSSLPFSSHNAVFPSSHRTKAKQPQGSPQTQMDIFSPLTSRHFLHEDLEEPVLTDRAQVLDDVPVPQALVESDLLVQRL